MIGRIKGQLINKKPPQLLVDVQGIGYQLYAPLSTFMRLPDLNEEVILYTEFIVREDAQVLYGFISETDRELFQKIIKVNGVGPKLALSVLSSMEPHIFARTIEENDVQALVKLPGVGKKTAERLVIELRDKLKTWHTLTSTALLDKKVLGTHTTKEEAIAALEVLGFKPKEAEKAIIKVYDEGKTAEELIKLALQGS